MMVGKNTSGCSVPYRTGYRTLTVNLFYDGGKTLRAREVAVTQVVSAERRGARRQPVDKMIHRARYHVGCLSPPEKE
jgi:hypothetical protein